jgi:hypothetical protein
MNWRDEHRRPALMKFECLKYTQLEQKFEGMHISKIYSLLRNERPIHLILI